MAKRVKRPAESWWYTLKADEQLPAEEQSRFLLRPLTGAERMRVFDDISDTTRAPDGTVTILQRGFRQARELVLSHVESIENFPAGEAQPWPAKASERERYLEMMDDLDVWEVGNEIREHSRLEPDAAPAPAEARDAEAEAQSVPNS